MMHTYESEVGDVPGVCCSYENEGPAKWNKKFGAVSLGP
jgi:hypothetical protein